MKLCKCWVNAYTNSIKYFFKLYTEKRKQYKVRGNVKVKSCLITVCTARYCTIYWGLLKYCYRTFSSAYQYFFCNGLLSMTSLCFMPFFFVASYLLIHCIPPSCVLFPEISRLTSAVSSS